MAASPNNARKLTTYQKAVLIQILRSFPNERVEIRYSADSDDAFSYAQDFLCIFKAIGWDVDGPEVEPGAQAGLTIHANGNSGAHACVEALRDALRIYEIEPQVRHENVGAISSNFILTVGASPARRQSATA
jgi:hypothetical protein